MSIATQQAKERENRTSDVKIMGKTVKLETPKLGGAVVPLGRAVVPLVVLRGSTAWRAVVPLVSGFFTDQIRAQFWGGNG